MLPGDDGFMSYIFDGERDRARGTRPRRQDIAAYALAFSEDDLGISDPVL